MPCQPEKSQCDRAIGPWRPHSVRTSITVHIAQYEVGHELSLRTRCYASPFRNQLDLQIAADGLSVTLEGGDGRSMSFTGGLEPGNGVFRCTHTSRDSILSEELRLIERKQLNGFQRELHKSCTTSVINLIPSVPLLRGPSLNEGRFRARMKAPAI